MSRVSSHHFEHINAHRLRILNNHRHFSVYLTMLSAHHSVSSTHACELEAAEGLMWSNLHLACLKGFGNAKICSISAFGHSYIISLFLDIWNGSWCLIKRNPKNCSQHSTGGKLLMYLTSKGLRPVCVYILYFCT